MKYKGITLLSIILLIIVSCAKPNEPASIEGSLTIEHVYSTIGYARDISITSSNLYIAEDQAGYSIYDLSSKELISRHTSFIMEIDPIMFENVRAVSADEENELLFVYDRYGSPASISVFDMTDKIDPEFIFQISGNTSGIIQLRSGPSTLGGTDLTWTNGSTYNFGRFDELWLGSNAFGFQNSVGGFDLNEAHIFLAAEQLGFHIVDRSNGDLLSTTDTEAEALDVKIVDSHAIVALRQGGFAVYNVSNISDPVLERYVETNDFIYNIDIEGNNLVLGSHSGGVYHYDITDITNPVLTGNLNSDIIGYTFKVKIKNNKIYASTRHGVYEIKID
ncbi:MAG: hypothetical protein K9N07_06855 [Candidatus Cloacimonetes bacterium]|nr:hypothetical protein [Candidatus Cloacimonadota bacterium]